MSIADKLGTIAENEQRVYEAGQNEMSLAYWNAITDYGTRTTWETVSPFQYGNYSDIKFPKPIVISGSASRLFRMYKGNRLPRKEDINMSGVTACNEAFAYMYGSKETLTIPDYGLPALTSYTGTYYYCNAREIELIRCHKDTTFNDIVFSQCKYLTDVSFEGEIGTTLWFGHSPLSVKCMKHIISHLVNYAGTENEYVYKITFTSACKTALEAEGNTSPNGNTWLDYMTDLGWNH